MRRLPLGRLGSAAPEASSHHGLLRRIIVWASSTFFVLGGVISGVQGEATLARPWLGSWPEGVPTSLTYPDISAGGLLRPPPKKFPTRPAGPFYGEPHSYA